MIQTKKVGGVAMYIKSYLDFSDSSYMRFEKSNKDIECQRILICQPHSTVIVMGNIYRPPQGNVDAFVCELENIVTDIDLKKGFNRCF